MATVVALDKLLGLKGKEKLLGGFFRQKGSKLRTVVT
jgi:hypothetical protein